jgi:hypothetical protein
MDSERFIFAAELERCSDTLLSASFEWLAVSALSAGRSRSMSLARLASAFTNFWWCLLFEEQAEF